jgi:hypothetical protein
MPVHGTHRRSAVPAMSQWCDPRRVLWRVPRGARGPAGLGSDTAGMACRRNGQQGSTLRACWS